jgi:SAM-dependent methyltransferase
VGRETDYHPRQYWEERFSAGVGLSTVGHMGLGSVYNSWLYRARFRALRTVLRRVHLDPGGASVLDVGAGSGAYLPFWTSRGARSVTATDFTSASLRALRLRYPRVELQEWDITAPSDPLGDRSFDIVTAFDVLFHVTDDRDFGAGLERIVSHVGPHGWLLLSDGFGHTRGPGGTHECHRSQGEYESILGRAGLSVEIVAPIFVLMSRVLDFDSAWAPLTRRIEGVVTRLAAGLERHRLAPLNHGLGAALYALDAVATRVSDRGPGLHLMAARRR